MTSSRKYMRIPIILYMISFTICVLCIFQYGHFMFVLSWKVQTWPKTQTKTFRIILTSYPRKAKLKQPIMDRKCFDMKYHILFNLLFIYVIQENSFLYGNKNINITKYVVLHSSFRPMNLICNDIWGLSTLDHVV